MTRLPPGPAGDKKLKVGVGDELADVVRVVLVLVRHSVRVQHLSVAHRDDGTFELQVDACFADDLTLRRVWASLSRLYCVRTLVDLDLVR